LAALQTCDLLRIMFSHKSHAFRFRSLHDNELRLDSITYIAKIVGYKL